MRTLLEVKGLNINIEVSQGTLHAVRGIDFNVYENDSLGIVGESGSGKSVSMKAIMGLSAPNTTVSGNIIFEGKNLVDYTEKDFEKIRGNKIAIVSQNPSGNLNPIIKIGKQMSDVIKARELLIRNAAKTYLKKQSKNVGINLLKCTDEEVEKAIDALDLDNHQKKAALYEILMQKHHYSEKINKSTVKEKAINLLKEVGIDNPELRYNQYPFELSGGMKQRVVIAIALSGNPKLVIFDEPTTALDATIQTEILLLIKKLQKDRNFSFVFITHNLAVISKIVNRVIVMYAGKILEEGSVKQVIDNPTHPYTIALFKSVPTLDRNRKLYSIPGNAPDLIEVEDIDQFAYRNDSPLEIDFKKEPPLFEIEEGHKARSWLCHEYAPKLEKKQEEDEPRVFKTPCEEKVLEIRNLSKQYYSRYGDVHALIDLSLEVRKGEMLCVVGESGSGKTTLAKVITGLEAQNSGEILLNGNKLSYIDKKKYKYNHEERTKIQMIYQDSQSALNPKMTIREIIAEGLYISKEHPKEEFDGLISEVLKKVDLPENILNRYPYMLSGGQKQRVQIARCLIANPLVLIADEPVSDLDVSIQANIINLFDKLKNENNLTIILIAHDLSLVQYIADKVAVMYCGRLVEYGTSEDVFKNPVHLYTKTLLNSVPDFDYQKELVKIDRPKYESVVSGTYTDLGNGHIVFKNV